LLASGNFYPADACDYDAAILLTNAQQPASDDSPDEEPDDELQDLNALPIEAATPPSRKRAKKAE
jgi:hypothetical protein